VDVFVLDLPRFAAGARLDLGKSPPHSRVDQNIIGAGLIKRGVLDSTKKYASVQFLRYNSLPVKDLHPELDNSK
jgi:hypothetical protein